MNFEQWWNTLTIKEQSLIGKNNAQYVWDSACEECANVCEKLGEEDDSFYAEFSRSDDCAKAIRAKVEKQ